MNRRDATDQLFTNLMRTKQAMLNLRVQCPDGQGELNGSQISMLFHIKKLGRPTVGSIAEALHITPGAVSQTIESLEKLDLVIREHSTTDRRSFTLLLSSDGEKLIHHLESKRYKLIEHVVADFSEEEIDILLRAQTKMLQALQQQTDITNKEVQA